MNKVYYTATPKGEFYDLVTEIYPDDAVSEFDVGETRFVCLTKDMCEKIMQEYRDLGYTPVSTVRAILTGEQ